MLTSPLAHQNHLENIGVLRQYQKALLQCPLLLQYCSNIIDAIIVSVWVLPFVIAHLSWLNANVALETR